MSEKKDAKKRSSLLTRVMTAVPLVAGLVAALVLINYLVLGLLATRIGNGASSIAFWLLGGLIAWAVLQRRKQ